MFFIEAFFISGVILWCCWLLYLWDKLKYFNRVGSETTIWIRDRYRRNFVTYFCNLDVIFDLRIYGRNSFFQWLSKQNPFWVFSLYSTCTII